MNLPFYDARARDPGTRDFFFLLVVGMRAMVFMRELSDIDTTFWTKTVTIMIINMFLMMGWFFDIDV